LFYKTSLLACSTRTRTVWYMPMHIAEIIACIIFLHMKIFVCLIKQACLLAIISKFGAGVTIAFYGWAPLNKNVIWGREPTNLG
jgi:hypothetical protein